MSNTDVPPLDDKLRALVKGAAGFGPAPASAKARVLARVEAYVGPPTDGGGGDAGAGEPQSRAARPAASLPRATLVRRALPLVASFALGGGAGVLVAHRTPPPAAAPPPPQIIYVDRPVPAAPARPTPPGEPTPPGARASEAQEQLTAERRLLDDARTALERDEPRAALQATTHHLRRYPNGILAQEREAMAIRVLVQLDRAAEARRRAARFRARYPDSLFLPAIESALGPRPVP